MRTTTQRIRGTLYLSDNDNRVCSLCLTVGSTQCMQMGLNSHFARGFHYFFKVHVSLVLFFKLYIFMFIFFTHIVRKVLTSAFRWHKNPGCQYYLQFDSVFVQSNEIHTIKSETRE